MGLARALMKAGYGTRKQAETMIAAGRLAVGGATVLDPRRSVGPSDDIVLDGQPLARLVHSYYAFNKPLRVACTGIEGADTRLVSDFFPSQVPGLQTAGRLDVKTTGLLLISNDRPWINLITGNSNLEQEYRIQVEGELTPLEIGVMTAGVLLPNLGLFRPLSVKVVEIMNSRTVITMVVRQGKIRQVRRMLGTLRHKVIFVRRIRIGEIRLGDLASGSMRELTAGEIQSVKAAARANPPAEE
jgi:23S rRNA pseudouridine2605 synthase